VVLRSGPRCEIDRSTRTVRRLEHDGGVVEFDRYRLVGERPWPHRIRATSDDGELTIRFRDVDVNGGIAEAAFRVPRRAVPIE
ncbi:MAG: hypothetical protein KDA28_07095, partial [Phycisphaerales bacterium]|nr:hypothetical protein [Phycisphaerales bacterium]